MQKVILVGISKSQGTFKREDGRTFDYDNTIFHCLVPLTKGVGNTVEQYKMKGSVNYERYKDLAFPCDCELDFVITKRGNNTSAELVGVTPL